jgi:hypothetical protein
MFVINHMPVAVVYALVQLLGVVSASSILYIMLLFDHLYTPILTG